LERRSFLRACGESAKSDVFHQEVMEGLNQAEVQSAEPRTWMDGIDQRNGPEASLARRYRFSISSLPKTGVKFGVNIQNAINPAKPSA
jgi:hypothetical protein